MVVPAVAHVGEELAGSNEGINAALCIGTGDAVGLMFRLGGAESVVVGGNGDEGTARHDFLNAEFAASGTLVGTVDGEMAVESQSFGGTVACDAVAKGDGAGERDGVAVGVGGGVDEVVSSHVVGGVAHRVGDVDLVIIIDWRVGDGLFGASRQEAEQGGDEKEYTVFHFLECVNG